MSRTHPRISVAASAIVKLILEGGWIERPPPVRCPTYIKEWRRLKGNELKGAWNLACKRGETPWASLWAINQYNRQHVHFIGGVPVGGFK